MNIASTVFPFLSVPLFIGLFFNQEHLKHHRTVTRVRNTREVTSFLLYLSLLVVILAFKSCDYSVREYVTHFEGRRNYYSFVVPNSSLSLACVLVKDLVLQWSDLVSVASSFYVSNLVGSLVHMFETQNKKLADMVDSSELNIVPQFNIWRTHYEGKV